MKPQGNPHQPRMAERAIPSTWDLMAHRRQLTCCRLPHRVSTSADQTQ